MKVCQGFPGPGLHVLGKLQAGRARTPEVVERQRRRDGEQAWFLAKEKHLGDFGLVSKRSISLMLVDPQEFPFFRGSSHLPCLGTRGVI